MTTRIRNTSMEAGMGLSLLAQAFLFVWVSGGLYVALRPVDWRQE